MLDEAPLLETPRRAGHGAGEVRAELPGREGLAREEAREADPTPATDDSSIDSTICFFTEHFESVSLHGYRRGLKSPLVAVGPFKFERNKFKFSESRRDADFEFARKHMARRGHRRKPA